MVIAIFCSRSPQASNSRMNCSSSAGYREEQAALAGHILEALCSRSLSLSEAGVEIGKTHAYLIAAALAKRGRVGDFWLKCKYSGMAYIAEMPVVVATSSIALQKAIVKDYIPKSPAR